jgi:hypothetical protein
VRLAGADFNGVAFIIPQGLAETWNGTRWTLQATPAPAGSLTSMLNGMSCSPAGACTAVGYTFQMSVIQVTLAVTRP